MRIREYMKARTKWEWPRAQDRADKLRRRTRAAIKKDRQEKKQEEKDGARF